MDKKDSDPLTWEGIRDCIVSSDRRFSIGSTGYGTYVVDLDTYEDEMCTDVEAAKTWAEKRRSK